jgi:hypothetical protein
MKVVINRCHGGFGLSEKFWKRYAELKNFVLVIEPHTFFKAQFFKLENGIKTDLCVREIERNDPIAIQVIEEIGCKEASAQYADLKIVDIPDDVEWTIDEYDGLEWVAEKHSTWS